MFGLIAALVSLLPLAIATVVIPNALFVRMTPVRVIDYVFLIVSVVLVGVLGATFALPGTEQGTASGAAGGVLSTLAIGCPICNKIVVALLGISGALTYFEPIQPLIGVAGIGLLALSIVARLSRSAACPTPSAT